MQQVEAGTRRAVEAKSLAEQCKDMCVKKFDESILIANAAKQLATGLIPVSKCHLIVQDDTEQKKGLMDRELVPSLSVPCSNTYMIPESQFL